jgi:hypothetical protein
MAPPHIAKERLLSFMFGRELTREESDHIGNWTCEICKQAMLEAIEEYFANKDRLIA